MLAPTVLQKQQFLDIFGKTDGKNTGFHHVHSQTSSFVSTKKMLTMQKHRFSSTHRVSIGSVTGGEPRRPTREAVGSCWSSASRTSKGRTIGWRDRWGAKLAGLAGLEEFVVVFLVFFIGVFWCFLLVEFLGVLYWLSFWCGFGCFVLVEFLVWFS